MKALTFDDFYSQNKPKSHFMQGQKEYVSKNEVDKIDKYHEFVLQKFNPKMIVDLFEGVKKYIRIEYHYYTIKSTYGSIYGVVFSPSEINYIRYEGRKKIRLMDIEYPETLNHFISDCQRAGIELQFKETINILN